MSKAHGIYVKSPVDNQFRKRPAENLIFNKDPDALLKLKDRLEYLEFLQTQMKKINQLLKKNDMIKLKQLMPNVEKLLEPDLIGRTGYPPYVLESNNAAIRRLKKRIYKLNPRAQKSIEVKYRDFIYREEIETGQIKFIIDTIIDKEISDYLASWDFKYTKDCTWARELSNATRGIAKVIIKKLVDKL